MTPKERPTKLDRIVAERDSAALIEAAKDMRLEMRGRDRGYGICPDCGYAYHWEGQEPCEGRNPFYAPGYTPEAAEYETHS